MPPRKTPIISASYEHLRFWVCKLCATTPDPEHPTELLAEGSAARVQVGEGRLPVACDHPAQWLRQVAGLTVCKCGYTVGAGQVLSRGSVVCSVCQQEVRGPDAVTKKGGVCFACRSVARRLSLNPNPGHSGPYPASLFLERAAEHEGKILGPVPELGGPEGFVVQRELTVLSNFTPLGRLFALAALEDSWSAPGLRDPGFSAVTLCDKRELPDTRDHLRAFVCYRHGDGCDIGVARESICLKCRMPEPGYPNDPQCDAGGLHKWGTSGGRGLRLEPGIALIVYGGAAVGVAGWVKGRPILLMAPEGAALLDAHVMAGTVPLVAAIDARWAERVR